MSFNEFYLDALEKRNLALTQKRFAITMKRDAIVLRDKMNAILFGDDANYGIVSVIQQYYKLLQIGSGLSTHTPSFSDPQTAKNEFIDEFILSVTVPGDGPGGLYPPDPQTPSVGAEEPDPNSVWLTHFSIDPSPTADGLAHLLNELLTLTGTEASQNADYRGSYTQIEAAQQAIADQKGSGLLGVRTENSELNMPNGDAGSAYSIGNSGLDTPDAFQPKSQFMTALSNVGTALSVWKDQAQIVLDTLNGEHSAILTEYKVELPTESIEAVSDSVSQAEEFIQAVQEYISYFNEFTDTTSSTRDEFNEKLHELKSYTSLIRDTVVGICDAIPALMGNASSGLKKYLVFWVKDITRKPDGPYALLSTADDMITSAAGNIEEQNERLNFFDQDTSRWIQIPAITLIYDTPILNLDKSVKEQKITLLWQPIMSANKYCILIKNFDDIKNSLTNDAWENAEEFWITAKIPETGLLQNMLVLDTPEKSIIVRIIAYDSDDGESGDFDRMDDFNSKSVQSDIVSGELPFTQVAPVDGATTLIMPESLNLTEQQRLWINHAELVTIFAISEDKIQLDRDYGTIQSVQNIFGFYSPIGYSES